MFTRCLSVGLLSISFLNSGKETVVPTAAPTKYEGGRSTALQAIAKIGIADKVPIGITFGSKPRLCGQERNYSFSGLSTLEALRHASEGSGYNVLLADGVYDLSPPDLTKREQEVVAFRFPRFFAPPTTMADLGTRLTGYVSTSVEGAAGFIVNTLGKPEDEIVTIAEMRDVTGPQIANQIVKLGSKGVWTMHAAKADSDLKVGSTIFNIYSYHDVPDLRELTCPQVLSK